MRFLNAVEGQAHDCANATAACDFTEKNWSGRRGSNPQHPAWESKLSTLYFQHLQKRLGKITVHASA
jgi:hypothetical protein